MKESSFSLVTHTPSFSAFSFLMGVTFEALAAAVTLGLAALAGLPLPALRSSNDFTQFSTIAESSEEGSFFCLMSSINCWHKSEVKRKSSMPGVSS